MRYCGTKIIYKSLREARSMRDKCQHWRRMKLYIYKCDRGKHYHLTKQPEGKNPYVT